MSTASRTKTGTTRILIVEDSPTQAAQLSFLLEHAGCTARVASNGREALAMLGEELPDMILSDILMPEMDGFELCRTIKRDPRFKTIPVILVTALSDPEDVISGLESGANSFITKPYSEKYLLSRIEAVLANASVSDPDTAEAGLEITFAGKKHIITSTRLQILNLLLYSYETAVQKNQELTTLNKELATAQKELRHNVKELVRREQELNSALAEKEVLLSEIHHRVKNNLTALISLLSLEGSTEDTPAGKLLKQDLENRARSMALIHETLYRTHKYNEVDMEVYLTNLIDQIANTFRTSQSVRTVVDARGVMLDIPRATPCGLIINELVTNSFKYAFPESFDSQKVRNGPPTITISLSNNHGVYDLTVSDNGIGLPPGIDLTKTRSLGLKLVNFLAKHQMRANIEINSGNGTEFLFRFTE